MSPYRRGRAVLLSVACLSFVSLGLPDGVLGLAWPSIRPHSAFRSVTSAEFLEEPRMLSFAKTSVDGQGVDLPVIARAPPELDDHAHAAPASQIQREREHGRHSGKCQPQQAVAPMPADA